MNELPEDGQDKGCLDGLNVLLVDDSPEVLSAFAELLEMEGANVCATNSGREALDAALPPGGFHLLISDISMPDMDGHELLARLRRDPRTAGVPAIALSGLGPGAQAAGGKEIGGFDRYLGKPVMFDVLLQTIRELRRR